MKATNTIVVKKMSNKDKYAQEPQPSELKKKQAIKWISQNPYGEEVPFRICGSDVTYFIDSSTTYMFLNIKDYNSIAIEWIWFRKADMMQNDIQRHESMWNNFVKHIQFEDE